MNNRNIQSGMMPARKENMSKKFEAHQQNVQAHQAPVMSFHDVWNYDKCSDKKTSLDPQNLQTCYACCNRCSQLQMSTWNVFLVMSWSTITSWDYSEKLLRLRSKIQGTQQVHNRICQRSYQTQHPTSIQ